MFYFNQNFLYPIVMEYSLASLIISLLFATVLVIILFCNGGEKK